MVTVLAGTNSFELTTALRARVADFVSEHGELAYEQLEGDEEEYDRISEAVTSLPFLSSQKLVVVREPSANKTFQERAEELLGSVAETTTLLLVEPKLDKRSKYYKWLKTHTDFIEFSEHDEHSLTTWVVSYTKEQGGVIAGRDASYLVQRIGTNQAHLAQEIEKLLLMEDTITRELIDQLTEPAPQSKIFDLLDAAFSGNATSAINLYQDQRAQKVEPQEIIAMIGWQLRQVALAKTAGTKYDLVRDGRMSPFSAGKATRIASRVSLVHLKQFISDLTELDAQSKRESINLDQALRTYLLRLCHKLQ
jgi:DNA polymerase III subunit delta